MASELDIKIDGASLDLYPDEDKNFYLTKQIHDLSNLETRDADFSKTIQVPLTARNTTILRTNLPSLNRHTEAPINFLFCEALIKGVPVLKDGYALVRSQSKESRSITLAIVGGSARFFNQLKEEPLSDLDFSELNLEWTLDGIDPIVQSGGGGNPRTGIQFCRNSWYSNQSRRLYDSKNGNDSATFLINTELGESGFIMFFKTVLDKIFSNLTNLEVDDSALTPLTDYTDTGFFVPVPIVHDSFGAIEGTYAEVVNNSPQAITSPAQIIQFPTIIEDPNGNWNPVTNSYDFTETGFFKVTFNADTSGWFPGGSGYLFINLYKNTINDAGQIDGILLDESSPSGTMQSSVNVVAGDKIYMATWHSFSPPAVSLDTCAFIIEAQGTGRGRDVNVSSMLPDITQKQFVKEVFKLFNILATEENRVITLSLFENITNNKPVSLEFNTNKETTYSGAFISYGQNNILRYEENEAVERLDANTSFQILDLTLPENADKIVSKFSATDVSAVPGMENSTSVPNYELEYYFVTDNKMATSAGSIVFTTLDRNDIEAGDFISVGGDRRRVIAMITDFEGQVDVPFPNNSQDQDWYHWRFNKNDLKLHVAKVNFGFTGLNVRDGGNDKGYTFYSIAVFEDLRFLNLKEKYYKLLAESFERPFIVTAWCSFGVVKYLDLTGVEPVYIEELDAYFYLNKVEQWKFNGSCRVQLVKINY